MAIIMGKGCIEAIYGLMGWKGLIRSYNYSFFHLKGLTKSYLLAFSTKKVL